MEKKLKKLQEEINQRVGEPQFDSYDQGVYDVLDYLTNDGDYPYEPMKTCDKTNIKSGLELIAQKDIELNQYSQLRKAAIMY
jgi:hypothetical protein